jgi:hypothetical protein
MNGYQRSEIGVFLSSFLSLVVNGVQSMYLTRFLKSSPFSCVAFFMGTLLFLGLLNPVLSLASTPNVSSNLPSMPAAITKQYTEGERIYLKSGFAPNAQYDGTEVREYRIYQKQSGSLVLDSTIRVTDWPYVTDYTVRVKDSLFVAVWLDSQDVVIQKADTIKAKVRPGYFQELIWSVDASDNPLYATDPVIQSWAPAGTQGQGGYFSCNNSLFSFPPSWQSVFAICGTSDLDIFVSHTAGLQNGQFRGAVHVGVATDSPDPLSLSDADGLIVKYKRGHHTIPDFCLQSNHSEMTDACLVYFPKTSSSGFQTEFTLPLNSLIQEPGSAFNTDSITGLYYTISGNTNMQMLLNKVYKYRGVQTELQSDAFSTGKYTLQDIYDTLRIAVGYLSQEYPDSLLEWTVFYNNQVVRTIKGTSFLVDQVPVRLIEKPRFLRYAVDYVRPDTSIQLNTFLYSLDVGEPTVSTSVSSAYYGDTVIVAFNPVHDSLHHVVYTASNGSVDTVYTAPFALHKPLMHVGGLVWSFSVTGFDKYGTKLFENIVSNQVIQSSDAAPVQVFAYQNGVKTYYFETINMYQEDTTVVSFYLENWNPDIYDSAFVRLVPSGNNALSIRLKDLPTLQVPLDSNVIHIPIETPEIAFRAYESIATQYTAFFHAYKSYSNTSSGGYLTYLDNSYNATTSNAMESVINPKLFLEQPQFHQMGILVTLVPDIAAVQLRNPRQGMQGVFGSNVNARQSDGTLLQANVEFTTNVLSIQHAQKLGYKGPARDFFTVSGYLQLDSTSLLYFYPYAQDLYALDTAHTGIFTLHIGAAPFDTVLHFNHESSAPLLLKPLRLKKGFIPYSLSYSSDKTAQMMPEIFLQWGTERSALEFIDKEYFIISEYAPYTSIYPDATSQRCTNCTPKSKQSLVLYNQSVYIQVEQNGEKQYYDLHGKRQTKIGLPF